VLQNLSPNPMLLPYKLKACTSFASKPAKIYAQKFPFNLQNKPDTPERFGKLS